MQPAERRAAYACDVTYCTNKEVAFDYLKDRIALKGRPSRLRLKIERLAGRAQSGRGDQLIHRGLHFAIVDEADSVLIDEARTPLIISDRRHDTTEEEIYRTAVDLARELELDRDFELDDRERQVTLLDDGCARLGELAEPHGGIWTGRRRREELVRQALSALHLFQRDQEYLVKDDKVQIIDEYTGRTMEDRSWEHGLHQMIEVKEDVPVTGRQDTRARISYQRFFRRYLRLAGMTGTAHEMAGEFWSVYRLPVVRIPTNRPLRRSDLGERVLRRADAKWRAIVARITELHGQGRPVLVGTRSVKASETLSSELEKARIPHQVLNARQDEEEAEVIAQAGERGRVTVATNMAGRGTDIRLASGIDALGGLHVLATERHDARRIDRQLFGRCGRQGDPGSFESIVSIEDELLEVHGGAVGKWLVNLADQLAGRTESRIAKRLRGYALRYAQRAAGRLYSRMRRDLLKHDEQLESLLAFSGRPD
jgi:preprotein translocase subunit SecA